MAKHIFKGEGIPNFVPKQVGHHYVDTLNKLQYLAVGIADAADWKLVNATIESINELTASAITINTGTAGTAPEFIDNGVDTITLNVPLASDSGVTAGTISKTDYDSFSNRILNTQSVLYVVKNTGSLPSQHFNSIQAAIDSISTNSASNPWIIKVGPGVYSETLTMKPYVWVKGEEQDQTIVEAASGNHAVIAADNSGISQCLIKGATDDGFAAIYYASLVGTTNTAFFVKDCRFGNNDALAIADADTAETAIFIENCKFGSTYQFNKGFLAINGGRVVVRNSTTTGLSSPYPEYVYKAAGAGSQIVLNAVQTRSGTDTGNPCIHLTDGALLRATGVNVRGFGKALYIEDAGAPSIVDAVGFLCENNTLDIHVEHPGADGTFNGSANQEKIIVNPDSGFCVVISSNDGEGLVVVGNIQQGDRYDRLANLSKIARTATTLGVDEITEEDFIEVVSGLDIQVNEGTGFLNDPVDLYLKEIFWETTTLSLSANSTYYIYVDTNSTVQASLSLPSLQTVIVLGRVNTNGTGIRFIENSDLPLNHYGNKTEYFFRNVLGPVFEAGCIVTESGSNARRLNITGGSYSYGVSPFVLTGGSEITWERFYRNGSGGFTSNTGQNTLSNSQYDNNSGTLANLTAGYYAKHHLYALGGDTVDRFFVIQSQAQYATLAAAIDAGIPSVPAFMGLAVTRIAGIIVQQGTNNIIQIQDIRPRIGFSAPSGTAVTNHGDLIGLEDDDHLQYLLVNGTRAMTGPLNMSGQAITNVGNVDGVDVSAHASRHLPNGADALATAIVATVGTANAEGTANSFARSDHVHAHGNQAGGALHANATTSVAGFMSSTDKTKLDGVAASATNTPLTAAAPANVTKATAVVGVATEAARADHKHDVTTGVASALSTSSTSAEGSATSLARSDHTHAISITNVEISATSDATTTSGSDVLMASMTSTPAAGTYLVVFSTSLECSQDDQSIFVSIYVGGSQIAHSQREAIPNIGGGFGSNPLVLPVSTNCIATVNGSQAIEVRWRRNGGTATAHQRTLNLIKVG